MQARGYIRIRGGCRSCGRKQVFYTAFSAFPAPQLSELIQWLTIADLLDANTINHLLNTFNLAITTVQTEG
jgi:hypothetical protein